MIKFKFNYLTNNLAYQLLGNEVWYEVSEENKFPGNFGSQGFQLSEGWMNFSIQTNKIRVFYKQIQHGSELADFWEPQVIAYFRKDLPKQEEIVFNFEGKDEVEKTGGKWVSKTNSRN